MTSKETLLSSCVGKQWEKIGPRHHHGINVPLWSIHTKKSCGIGEFYDLCPLIDWCSSLGFDVIQLLPLNDTGDDPSPFFAISALALNPLYLSLHKLEGVSESDMEELHNFNQHNRIRYKEVRSHKLHFLRLYFEKMGSKVVKSKPYKEFVSTHDWVEHYALFKVLKDEMEKSHWKTWPKKLQNPSDEHFEELLATHGVEVSFYVFLQFLCYEQLRAVRQYAHEKGVFLKGDIPILISPDSADVWWFQDEFDLTHIAGSPPSVRRKEGQVWGLPLFNWGMMKSRKYDWWKKRLSYASLFYDIYRIDHILGFFRIYAMLPGQSAKEGVYIPENKEEWRPHGEEILTALCSYTNMLPIGEDLGAVPPIVRTVLHSLGICGTRVLRWEREEKGSRPFIDLNSYDPTSMSTVSTHDAETLTQWWRDGPEQAKAYTAFRGWGYNPVLSYETRLALLHDSHHTTSLFHINLLGEYLALFPDLVWENPDDERINLPGTVSPNNWTYRMRTSIEEIVSHPQLAEAMRGLLQ